MIDLKNKKILVTGGGGNGVASGICTVLDRMGAHLIINEIEENQLRKLEGKYLNADFIQADISDGREVNSMFTWIENNVGTLDGLVNNAGIGLIKNAHETTELEFDELYNVDVRGVWQVSKAFANHLLKHSHIGNIVNISSIHALRTIGRYALYSSAKSAVEGLTRGMAVELGKHNIRVNAVGPGYVHSDQSQFLLRSITDEPESWIQDHVRHHQVINVLMDAENCGSVVAFLLSPQSAGVTGQVMYVDNGTSLLLYNNDFIKDLNGK